jgi:hypothetical protein
VRSQGERYECPWEPCGGFYLLLPNGLVPVHTTRDTPCPGGGFDTNGPALREKAKMKARAHAQGL